MTGDVTPYDTFIVRITEVRLSFIHFFLFYFILDLFSIFGSRVRVQHDITHQSQSHSHISHGIS